MRGEGKGEKRRETRGRRKVRRGGKVPQVLTVEGHEGGHSENPITIESRGGNLLDGIGRRGRKG